MAKIIIGLTGLIASGKGTVKKYLVEKHGAKDCRFSTILRDILNRLDLQVNRDNLIELSTSLREKFGQDLLSKAIAKDAKNLDANIVVIDGIRRMDDINHLMGIPGFVLVSVDANPKVRYERLVKRNENAGDDKKTYKDFQADHKRETEMTIPGVMKHATESIENSGSLKDLYKQIDLIIKKQ